MASLQKISVTRYVIGQGKTLRHVPKGTPGARKVKEQSAKWYAVWREGGKKVKVPLSPDKLAAQAMLADLLRDRERGKAGLLDPYKEQKRQPIAEHTDAYLADLREQGRGETHVANTRNALYRVFDQCRFATLADLNPDKLDVWLAKQDCTARTKNWYRGAAVAFCNWLVRKKRLEDNPFRNTTRAKGGKVKRKRRALPLLDLLKLLETARTRPLADARTIRYGPRRGEQTARVSPERLAKLERFGQEKYLTYKTAVLTGLRRGELRKLEVGHLHLDGPTPFLHLPGTLADGRRGTKNGKDAVLPLKEDHARELREWTVGRARTDKVFDIPAPKRSIQGLCRDLKAAGIPYRDEQDRYFDFHSFRKNTSSFLHQAKVHPRIIQLFMRHSDPNLTAHYDDATLHDLRQACDALPPLVPPTDVEKELERRKAEWLQQQDRVNRVVEEVERQVNARLWPELEARLGAEKVMELKGWLVDRLFEKWKADQEQ